MGQAEHGAGHPNQAVQSFKEARDILQQLVERSPDVKEFQVWLSRAVFVMADPQIEADKAADALESCQQAEAILEKLAKQDPQSVECASDLAFTWRFRGQALAKLGQREPALAALERALELPGTLVDVAGVDHNEIGDGLDSSRPNP
jgi:tetratricopeptide (TPR) repeat protein